MVRLVNVATPLLVVVRDNVPLRVPPPRRDSVTVLLLSTLLNGSAILTATGGANVNPAVAGEGASCWNVMAYAAGSMTSDLLVEVKPVADAVRVLLPALVMTRSPKLADPSAAVLFVGVPLAKVPLLRLIVISTPLVRMLLLNGSWICTVKLDSVEPAMFVAAGTL